MTELEEAMGELNIKQRAYVQAVTGEHLGNQRQAYIAAYGNKSSQADTDAMASRLSSNVKVIRAIKAIEKNREPENENRRQQVLDGLDRIIKQAEAKGNFAAALRGYELKGRTMAMYSDKVIHEDVQAEQIKERERAELAALAQERVIKLHKEA